MADEFDPYYTWLAIPPAEQPADHYRLIGLRQFEGNADVICNAVDQKMQFLRTLQVGKRSALSQKLLNEISAAGGCLLDPQRKQAYDKELKAKESAKQPASQAKSPLVGPLPRPNAVLPLPTAGTTVARPAAPRPLPLPVAIPKAVSLDDSPTSKKDEFSSLVTAARPSTSWKLPVLAAGGVLALIALTVTLIYASGLLGPGEQKIAIQPNKNGTPIAPGTPNKGELKPAPKVPPGETIPDPAMPVVQPAKTKTPSKDTTTPPPTSAAQPWWKDPSHVERLVALQIGTDAHAELPESASRCTLAEPMTAELWLRLHLEGDQPVQILGTLLGGEGVVPKGWGLFAKRLTQGDSLKAQLYVEFWKTTGEFVRLPVALPAAGEWHHLAFFFDPSQRGRLFIDGRPLEFPAEKDLKSSGRNLVLGSATQPAGASFKAEVCGLRVSEGTRYSQQFTPPSPLGMSPDKATFAAVDCRLYQPAASSPEKPYPWLYGTGKVDSQSKQIVNFQPLRYGTARQWQGGNKRPDNELDWIALDPFGGCPGNGPDQLAIRRWTAPVDGEVTVSGRLRHFHSWRAGDGVKARIVSSSTGEADEWSVFFTGVDTPVKGLKVQAGDTIDFVVDCGKNSDCDNFEWIVDVKLVDTEQRAVGTWNSARDFRVLRAPNQAASSLREPVRNKAPWIPLEDFAVILRSTREAGGEPAKLVVQYAPAAVPSTNPTPLTLKPVPVKPNEPSPFGEPPPFEAPVAAKKSPVPDAAALAKARAELISTYGEDLKAAKSPTGKQELAQKIFEVIKEIAEPPTRYVLLLEVRRLAVEGRDGALATQSVELLGAQFEVDLLAQKVKLFESLAAEGLTPAQRGDLISATCELGYEALDADQYEALQAIVIIARSMMVKAAPEAAKTEAKEFFDAYAHIQKRMEAVKKAEQTVKTAPNEPGANLILGLYHHFTRGDSGKGLPQLAKGSNKELATAAKAREENLAKGVASSLAEADAWHEAITTAPPDYKTEVQQQALEGYTFLATSAAGLEKIKAEKRRDELEAEVAAAPVKRGTKRIRASDIPEFTNGLVGRVKINGKDAGVFLTFVPGNGRMDYQPLNDILQKSKATGLQVVMQGYVSCQAATDISVSLIGQLNGPGQILTVRGNKSIVGGNSGFASDSYNLQLPAGDHLVQWAFDYAGTTTPRINFYDNNNGRPVQFRSTRQQVLTARKLATSSEANLSN